MTMTMNLLLLLLLATASVTTTAFVIPTPSTATTRPTFLAASVEAKPSSAAASAAKASPQQHHLTTEYAAARDAALEQLEAKIGDKASPGLLSMLNYFVSEYLQAHQDANDSNDSSTPSEELAPQAAAQRILQCIGLGFKYGMPDSPEQYSFGVQHTALRGNDPEQEDGNTFDYYKFGCDFFKPCMNLPQSVVLGKENAQQAFEQVAKGENVVFFANHQSEADPQVFSILLEEIGFGSEAARVTYVAGHKVTTDTLAIPFSMGRSLLCIHSKKHIDADPDTKSLKQRQNLQAMSAMVDMMKKGGASLWVAPSGGRDRRDVEKGEVPIAPFDSKTIDMFRLMGNKSKVPTHYYPLSMVTYELCPPPDHVEAGVGEERNVRFVPIGICIGEELENKGGLETRHLFAEQAEAGCDEGYHQVLKAIEENMKKEG